MHPRQKKKTGIFGRTLMKVHFWIILVSAYDLKKFYKIYIFFSSRVRWGRTGIIGEQTCGARGRSVGHSGHCAPEGGSGAGAGGGKVGRGWGDGSAVSVIVDTAHPRVGALRAQGEGRWAEVGVTGAQCRS